VEISDGDGAVVTNNITSDIFSARGTVHHLIMKQIHCQSFDELLMIGDLALGVRLFV